MPFPLQFGCRVVTTIKIPTAQLPGSIPQEIDLVLGERNNSLANQVSDSVATNPRPYGIEAPNDTKLDFMQTFWAKHKGHQHIAGFGALFFTTDYLNRVKPNEEPPLRKYMGPLQAGDDVTNFRRFIQENAAKSTVSMFHVRAAETGEPSKSNAHPFYLKKWGLTMNGDMDIDKGKLDAAWYHGILTRKTTDRLLKMTDSEQLLIILCDALNKKYGTTDLDELFGRTSVPEVKQALLEDVKNTIVQTFKVALLFSSPREDRLGDNAFNIGGSVLRSPNATITLSNGQYTFVINHDSKQWLCVDKKQIGGKDEVVSATLASEPIYNQKLWQELPNDSLLTVVTPKNLADDSAHLSMTLQSVDLPSAFDLWRKRPPIKTEPSERAAIEKDAPNLGVSYRRAGKPVVSYAPSLNVSA